jgi:hypothetical protein
MGMSACGGIDFCQMVRWRDSFESLRRLRDRATRSFIGVDVVKFGSFMKIILENCMSLNVSCEMTVPLKSE